MREDSDAFIRLYKAVLETGRSVEQERPVSVRAGGYGWRRVNVITVDRDVVAVVAFDVTGEVEGRESLERERVRFASLVARSSDLACVVDARGEIVYSPTPEVRFLGYSSDELGAPLTKVIAADPRRPGRGSTRCGRRHPASRANRSRCGSRRATVTYTRAT